MAKTTSMYFVGGVYASFDGMNIELTANGIGRNATDWIYLDPSMILALKEWAESGYKDYNSGEKFDFKLERS